MFLNVFPKQFKKSVSVAVSKELAHSSNFEAGLGWTFGVELCQPDTLVRDCCNKGNIVLLCHGVIYCDKVFIFDNFNVKGVIAVTAITGAC